MKFLILTAVTVCILQGSVYSNQSPEMQLAELEHAVIENRRSVRTGLFEMTLFEEDAARSSRFRVWFDHDNHRTRVDSSSDGKQWSKFAIEGDKFFWHKDKGDVAAEMGSKSHTSRTEMTCFDPRCAGLIATPFQTLYSLTLDDFKSPNRTNTSIEQQGEIVIARYDTEWASLEKHFSKALDNAVVFIQISAEARGKRLVDSVKSEYANGSVMPSTITYRRQIDSKTRISETVTIRNMNPDNEPIPPSVFSFAGMNVPENTFVVQKPKPKGQVSGVWDGEKMDYSGDRLNRRASPSRISRYWALAILGIAVAVVSLFLLVKRNDKKSPTE